MSAGLAVATAVVSIAGGLSGTLAVLVMLDPERRKGRDR